MGKNLDRFTITGLWCSEQRHPCLIPIYLHMGKAPDHAFGKQCGISGVGGTLKGLKSTVYATLLGRSTG